MRTLGIGLWTGLAVAAAAAAAAVWTDAALPRAAAAAGATAHLGAGGVAKGDVSLRADEEDRVTIDLVAGATLTARFASTFAADVAFLAPDGTPLDLGWGVGPKRAARPFPVTRTGRHEFRIRSANGSQGKYALTVLTKWPKKVTLPGTTGGTVTWNLPKGASVAGKVAAFPARSWDPTIDGVTGPGGAALLGAPVPGAKGWAALPRLTAGADGAFEMSVSGGTPGGEFRAALVLSVPKTPPVKADLSDGLTTVSFATDGVKSLLEAECSSCHAWVGSPAAFKRYARQSLARVESGQMPQGRPPLAPAQIDVLRQWIATGMAP